MKKVLLIVVSILVLAAVGAYAYISMIDWNQHKDKIAEQFSEITGKRVVFEGPVSFTIFPSPYLTATNIKVYNQQGENLDVPLASIRRLIASLSLGPLLKGDFEVKMMSLVEPNILMEVSPDGKLNWQSDLTETQKTSLEDINVTLDSVMLEKATLNFVNVKHDVDVTLENLNAEVIAPSIFGPYRIEGSYIKDNNPEGFAVSLGRFSENFATSLNFVLNHPTSQTFVRFDGSVLLKNDALNGNLIIESKKPVEFVNKTFKDFQLDEDYNYPLAFSAQVDTNKTKAALSNIVVKYGTTVGAGNVLLPLAENDFAAEDDEAERRKLEIGFEMTNLDLQPVVHTVKKLVDKYKAEGAVYNPQLGYDLIADVKSLNSTYNGQNIKDFNLSLDYFDNILTIKNLSATMTGDTTANLSGDIFSDNDELTYSLKASYNTTDLQKFAKWLGYDLVQVSPSTYKRSVANASLEGTLKTIKLAPFDITLDKSSVKGEIGIITGSRNNMYMNINGDNINFDNYIKPLPKEELQKPFAERMAYRFKNLSFLNDADFTVNATLNLGIYENIPFENTQLNADIVQGVMNINKLNIGSIANASVDVGGKVKGFGAAPQFENLKYDLATKDVSAFLNKFEIDAPKINMKNLKNFSSKGITTGNMEKIAIKAVSKLEYIDTVYSGQLQKNEGAWLANGDLEVRAPDFVQLVNDLSFNYSPKAFSLGIFNLSSKLVSGRGKYRLHNINAYVGSNNFKGTVLYDDTTAKNDISADLQINKFEIERFFYNDLGGRDNKVVFRAGAAENEEFIAKPFLDKTKINYAFYNSFNLKGNFVFDNLSYKNLNFDHAVMNMELRDGVLNMSRFNAAFNQGTVNTNFVLDMNNTPGLNGDLELVNQKIADGHWSGKKYGIKSGELNSKINFSTNAASADEMLSNLTAGVDFSIANPVMKGWNLAEIDMDLRKRDKSEGLAALVSENLQKSETVFDSAAGKINIEKANYTFSNTEFKAADWVVKMQDSGSLDSWDMDAKFDVELLNAKVKPFSFVLSGPMISPKLSVDVNDITEAYDAHWAKVAEDKKAAEKARKDYLDGLMKEQQDHAQKTMDKVLNGLMPELSEKRSRTENEDILKQYQVVENDINNVRKGLDDIVSQGLVVDFDESLPKSLGEQNVRLEEAADKLYNDIAKIYQKDVKQRINGVYNEIVDIYNQSKVTANGYRDKYGDYPKRLAMIKTLVDIDKDDKVIALKKSIEDDLLALDAINSQIVKDYIFIQNSGNVVELEEYAGKIKGLLEQAAKDSEALNEDIAKLFAHAETLTAAEEKAYADKLKEEEIKKKLEENTGKISGAKGGDITVMRDISEIQKMEEAKKKEDIPVLDFTSKSPKGGVIKKPTIIMEDGLDEEEVSVEEQPEDDVIQDTTILRKPAGEISKATGVIIREER